jgi:hypothetical protein
MRIRRLGPAEARPLISSLKPNAGDAALDHKIDDAVARFLSRHHTDHQDALEKLRDAFERLKAPRTRRTEEGIRVQAAG